MTMRSTLCFTPMLALVCSWVGMGIATAQPVPERFEFSYEFASGHIFSGDFLGYVTPLNGSFFDGTVTVFGNYGQNSPPTNLPAHATLRDPSGTLFSWDTSMSTDSTSQTGLIGRGELAFVSFDASKIDLAFSSNSVQPPPQVLLSNGWGTQPDVASIRNLFANDLVEPFVPARWSLTMVPEPSLLAPSVLLLAAGGACRSRNARTKDSRRGGG